MEKIIKLNIDIFVVYILINLYTLLKVQAFLNGHDARISCIGSAMLIVANLLLISSIYLLNKVSDQKEDQENSVQIKKINTDLILKYYGFANLISFILYFYLGNKLLLFWLVFFFIGLFYSYPRRFRLKNIFLVKNLVASFSWYLSICLLVKINIPVLSMYDIFLDNIILWFSLILFEVLWDLPDRFGDKVHGIKTLPVVFGFEKTKLFLIAVNILIIPFIETNMSKALILIIIFFLFFIKEDTRKSNYHLIILVISAIYSVYGLLLLSNI